MRVAIDAHAIGTRAGGNETYVRALLAALRDHAVDIEPIALQTPDAIARGDTVPGIETVPIPFANSPLRALWGVGAAATKARADLIHAQYYVPPICPLPCVVSAHDVAWRACPETLPPLLRFRLERTMRGTLRRAKRVLVLTEAVKREIQEHYAIPADRIDVVAPYPDAAFSAPISDDSVNAIRSKYNLPNEFILYAGAMHSRKNLLRLARAVIAIPDAPPLAIAGPRIWGAETIHRELEQMKQGGRVVLLDYVDREDLPVLMRAARIFAYVPLYEGFGLPVIEALAAGATVLASNIPALREVAGDAAYFADPYDDAAIRSAFEALLSAPVSRDQLRTAGRIRAATFAPETMAATAASAYKISLA